MKFEGSIVALITPMKDSGAVDYDSLGRLIEHHISSGTNGIVAVGTTGESATLNPDEHISVIKHTIKQVNHRIPVIAGTGANSTEEAIFLTKNAHDLGADAALLVVPYYNKPTQEGLYQHFRAIAEAVPIPQFLYNVPGRSVADMSNDTVLRLAQVDNIVGLKDATGDLQRGKALLEECDSDFIVLSGDDPTALDYIKLGAKGDISVTANVAPRLMAQMCAAGLSGDFDTAERCDVQLRDLHRDLFVESNPIPVKYAVAKMGYTSNVLRLPLTPLSRQYQADIDAAMQVAGE